MYTDEYSDEQEEEIVTAKPSNNPSNGMNIKIIIIAVLLFVMIGLILFILKGKGGSKNEYVLNVQPDPIVLSVGKTQNIAYDVRKDGIIIPNAIVQFTIADTGIASIDSTVITAENYGQTKLTAVYVATNGKTYQKVTDVTIAEGDPSVRASSVTFPNGDLEMSVGGTYDLVLTVLPANGYIESREMVSSDPRVVTVDSKGTITAVGEGSATINVNVNNGQFVKDIQVFVSAAGSGAAKFTASPISITISSAVKSVNEGESATLKYTITPSEASLSSLKWSSSDTKVLKVDNKGKITGVKEGSATITVKTSNGITDSVTIQVNKKGGAVTSIGFPVSDLAFLVGQSQLITPTIEPSTATNVKLTYTSSNPAIFTVTPSSDTLSATLNAVSSGTAVLTIKADNGVEKKVNIITIGG